MELCGEMTFEGCPITNADELKLAPICIGAVTVVPAKSAIPSDAWVKLFGDLLTCVISASVIAGNEHVAVEPDAESQ